jgi:ubiquinone/menaquinone biosynthesis C-methylase UbiE
MHGKAHANGEQSYIPAAGKDWLLPLYDPLVALLMRNEATRGRLVAEAEIAPGHRVLDLGCGTGSLTVLIHARHPGAAITAIDPDPLALARAEAKAKRAKAEVRFERAFGNALPFADASFDRVLSSLVLHHLTREVRIQTLAEARRVLAPGGSLHVLDFGPPRSRLQRALGSVVHHGPLLDDHRAGRIPEQMRAAGFAAASERASIATAFGSLSIYRAEG